MAGKQPKKPTGGAYGQYMAEMRPALQKECAGKPVTHVTKLGGARFKALGDSEKSVYEKRYQEAKARYDERMKAFLDAGGKKTTKSKKKMAEKTKKDPAAPKKPTGGAYGCFLAKHREEFRKETTGQPVTAVTKLASTRWQALGQDKKKPYEDAYLEKKAAYEEAMKSYVPLPGAEANERPAKKQRVSKEDEKAAKQTKASEKRPDKKAKAGAKKATPKGKAKAKAVEKGNKAIPEASSVKLEACIAVRAEKADLKDKLLKLAACEDVISSGKSQTAMLEALEENKGLLHAAKRALLRAGTESE
jgi:hypothetical protein